MRSGCPPRPWDTTPLDIAGFVFVIVGFAVWHMAVRRSDPPLMAVGIVIAVFGAVFKVSSTRKKARDWRKYGPYDDEDPPPPPRRVH